MFCHSITLIYKNGLFSGEPRGIAGAFIEYNTAGPGGAGIALPRSLRNLPDGRSQISQIDVAELLDITDGCPRRT
jgi:hypothetical protein